MSKKKSAYAELQARLARAEALLDALRRGEMDTLLGPSGPLKIRLQALIEENERLAREWQTTFDVAQDAIWVLDTDQRILRANKAAEEVFGCPLAEMPGRNCFDVAHHTDEPIPGCPFCLMRVSRQRESFEMQLGERWFEVTTDPILGENGNLIGAVHIARDITQRKQAEARTEHLNQVLRAIRDVNQLITHEQDRDALLRRACEILISTRGYRSAWAALRGEDGAAQMVAESGIGAGFAPVRQALACGDWPPCCRQAQERPDSIALIHDTIRNCTTCPLAHVYRDTAALAGALRYGGRDYGVLVVALPAGLADDPEEQSLFRELVGDVAYALHAIELAQAREKAEEALRESEEKYRSLFNQSVEGIYLHDLEGRILEVNEMACAQSGYTREEWLCRTVFDGHPAKSTTNLPKDEILRMWKEWVPGQRYTVEAEHQRKDGTVYPVEISTGIVRYKGGNAILAIVKDITARKQAEEQLRAAHAELQRLLAEAEQSRRALLSLVEDQKATEQALRESEERLRRRLTELTILYESSRVFAQLLSPASVAQQMIDTLSQHCLLYTSPSPRDS